MPLHTRSGDLALVAEVLHDAADGLLAQREALTRAVAALADWDGVAAPLARARLDVDGAAIARTADACRAIVPVLRACVEELLQAHHDWAEGDRLADASRAALNAVDGATTGPDAVAVAVHPGREHAEQELARGSAISLAVEDRIAEAEASAARALRSASGMLDVPAPPLAAAPDGDLGDGLRKAGEDVVGEITAALGGALDHVNVFSERWDDTWAETGRTIATAVTNPVDTGRSMIEGTFAPLGESYSSGGIDEAVGRSPGVIAGIVGGKGLTKLGRLTTSAPASPLPPDPRPGPYSPIAPGGLGHHEHLGGHTLDPNKAHVGATDQQLLDRQARDRVGRVSTYTDRPTAERAVNENLAGNRAAVDAWLRYSGGTTPEPFRWTHGEVVGRSAPRGADLSQIAEVSRSVVVLRRDPEAPEGYYIYTSYPEP